MSCFNFAGAQDLNELVADGDEIILSSGSDSENSDEELLLGKRAKKGRGRPTAKKRPILKPTEGKSTAPSKERVNSSSIDVDIDLVSDDDDLDVESLLHHAPTFDVSPVASTAMSSAMSTQLYVSKHSRLDQPN